jgi:DnaJ-class molecular chaperone
MADALKKEEILGLAGMLATLDYYQVLKVDRKAILNEVKKAFFRESQALHPDKFFGSSDAELKDAVMTIYKRVAEAYAVLRDPEMRAKYDQQLATGADAAKRLEHREAPSGANVPAADPKAKNSQAQKYLQLGLMALRKGDFSGAEMNLQFALKFEPGNDGIAKKLVEAKEKAKAKGDAKDPYKI